MSLLFKGDKQNNDVWWQMEYHQYNMADGEAMCSKFLMLLELLECVVDVKLLEDKMLIWLQLVGVSYFCCRMFYISSGVLTRSSSTM